MNIKAGLLIAFEGIDGSGKTTLLNLTQEKLIETGYSVEATKEPTKETIAGQKLRKSFTSKRASLEEELQWFMEDREWNVKNRILPALVKNKIILSDRYYYSTACYQGVRKNNDWKSILDLNRAKFPEPNLTIIIDIEPEVALQRIAKDRIKQSSFEDIKNLEAVRELYLEIVENDTIGNYLVLDGADPLINNVEKIFTHLIQLLE